MARNRRMIKFEEQFPEAIDLLARALRAGTRCTTGLSMVGDEMAEPVGPEFRLLFDQQNFGMPLPQALKAFADRIPILDARFFVTAVLTQREAGGNLSEVLDNLSSIIRDRFRVKRQVRVISAHGRITGWILSALPVSLALFFAFSSPETYRKFYTDPLGIKMIVCRAGRCRSSACSSSGRSCRSSTETFAGSCGVVAAIRGSHVHRSAVGSARGVCVGRAGRGGAGLLRARPGRTPEQRRDSPAVAARRDGVLAQLNLHGSAEPLGQALPAARAEVAEGHDAAAPPAVERRLPQLDGGGGLRRAPKR